MKGAYYNENDPFAAEWLRTLIFFDLIAPGDVDERSIKDVCADDLRGYAQHHFFAGIGVWSAALRAAGWPDDRPVWTGSCPCQPFSLAGRGAGFSDERHLWPAWHWLAEQHRPGVILGEQVASKPGLQWFDLVSSDLEGTGYACGAVDLSAAGVGAPHIRQRLWWLAHHHQAGRRWRAEPDQWPTTGEPAPRWADAERCSLDGRMADNDGWHPGAERQQRSREHGQQQADGGTGAGQLGLSPQQQQHWRGNGRTGGRGEPTDAGPVVDAAGEQAGLPGRTRLNGSAVAHHHQGLEGRCVRSEPQSDEKHPRSNSATSWSDTDWIACRDGKWRPVEPGTFPLAHGIAGRVGHLRGYGNALVLPLATAFVEAVIGLLQDA